MSSNVLADVAISRKLALLVVLGLIVAGWVAVSGVGAASGRQSSNRDLPPEPLA